MLHKFPFNFLHGNNHLSGESCYMQQLPRKIKNIFRIKISILIRALMIHIAIMSDMQRTYLFSGSGHYAP